jgi:hypothetical protein
LVWRWWPPRWLRLLGSSAHVAAGAVAVVCSSATSTDH